MKWWLVAGVLVVLGALGLGISGQFGSRSKPPGATATAAMPDGGDMKGMAMPAEGSSGTVMIDPRMQQLIGVRTVAVTEQSLQRDIRTVGTVQPDETRQSEITTRLMGYITKLFVNFTGEEVKPGDALYSYYSPDLVSAQQEYLLALEAVKRLGKSSYPEVARGSASLLESARRRLQLWNFSDEQIEALEQRGSPATDVTVFSEVGGTVVEKMALQGKQIMPGETLFRLADLSNVWVIADFYEEDAALLRTGQHANVELTYAPGEVLHGTVDYIYPYLDDKSRTVKVRLKFPNRRVGALHGAQAAPAPMADGMDDMPGMGGDSQAAASPAPGPVESSDWLLKPGMFVNVAVSVPVGRSLVVPEDAVIDTGVRQTVFVDEGSGHYAVRNVTLGVHANGLYAVLAGLRAGERVVSGATFLLDAESKLQTAMPAMPGMDMSGGKGAGAKDHDAHKGSQKADDIGHMPGM